MSGQDNREMKRTICFVLERQDGIRVLCNNLVDTGILLGYRCTNRIASAVNFVNP